MFGRRTNDALSRAFGYVASKKSRSNIGIAVHDNGFALIYPPYTNPSVKFSDIKSGDLEDILKKAVSNTELIRRRFRHVAARGLMILRNYKGHEISVNKQQLSAVTLLQVVKKIKDFPLLKETYREILEDYMDIHHAREVLEKVERGKIEVIEIPPQKVPSPFAHNIVLEGLSDIVLMEDRKAMIERFHKIIMERIAELYARKEV